MHPSPPTDDHPAETGPTPLWRQILDEPSMPCVYVASPLRGGPASELSSFRRQRNAAYTFAAMSDCLDRGEAPWPPHAAYPLVLDDTDHLRRGVR